MKFVAFKIIFIEKINIAKNMLKKNMSIEDISDVTGLSIEEIKKLIEN